MKISKILPQTPRLSKMDTEFAPSARPGSSTFGRIPGLVTSQDRVTISNDSRHLLNKFKNVAEVLPTNLSKVELNVDPELVTQDFGASQSDALELTA